jgi:hypothetical protein
MSHHQKAGGNHGIMRVTRSFENMAKFKYLGMTVKDQNLIHEEINSTLNSENAFYHSVQIFCLIAHY